MAANVYRFLRKPSLLRSINRHFLNRPNPNPSFQTQTVLSDSFNRGRIPVFHPPTSSELPLPPSSTIFYPSFPFGCLLKPIQVNVELEEIEEVAGIDSGEAGEVWADSVKKKRKKKMNKHKYKKLRKRLRRKT
ncbi:hypothetical protein AMTRI_Chr06g175830 [Amborella trichopoda]